MTRIICDTYFKGEKPLYGEDPHSIFNEKILAVNNLYGWLYQKGVLEKVSFEFKDYEDITYFALDASDLMPYRKEMEVCGVEGIGLAIHCVFDSSYFPCEYSGAIQLGSPMMFYRSIDGCVGRYCECDLIKSLNTDGIYDVLDVKDAYGVKAAVKHLFGKLDWNLTLSEQKSYEAAVKFYNEGANTDIDNDFVKRYGRELIFCYANRKPLIDFVFWTQYEKICNEKMTYDEYVAVDRLYAGDPFDIIETDREVISEIERNLNDYRASYCSGESICRAECKAGEEIKPNLVDQIQFANCETVESQLLNQRKAKDSELEK